MNAAQPPTQPAAPTPPPPPDPASGYQPEPFAALLARLRMERLLTQQDLAVRLGVATGTIAGTEQGRSVPHRKKVGDLLGILGSIRPLTEREAVDFLLGGECVQLADVVTTQGVPRLPGALLHDYLARGLIASTKARPITPPPALPPAHAPTPPSSPATDHDQLGLHLSGLIHRIGPDRSRRILEAIVESIDAALLSRSA